jgi:hypothetical protein
MTATASKRRVVRIEAGTKLTLRRGEAITPFRAQADMVVMTEADHNRDQQRLARAEELIWDGRCYGCHSGPDGICKWCTDRRAWLAEGKETDDGE